MFDLDLVCFFFGTGVISLDVILSQLPHLMQEGSVKGIIRTMGGKTEYEYPDNLGCTYIDQKGKLCAAIGCWAKALLENSKDLGDTPEAEERRKRIMEKAKAAGCKEALELG